MLVIAFVSSISLIFGAILGNKLATKGITADKRFDNHQEWFIGGLGGMALIVLLLGLMDQLNLTSWTAKLIPTIILLYLGQYADNLILSIGFFILGFLICLELAGRNSSEGMRQLLVATGVITVALAILLHFSLPITGMVTESKIINGVILQTTPYTCAPASIATLARFTGKHPNITEKDVVMLTQTNRFGTGTLAEIRAMQQLGLGGQYYDNLTLKDLIKINRSALLHVREKYQGEVTAHAVALLAINLKRSSVIIGNPWIGIQEKTFGQMKDYWMGEAIFVSNS